MNDLLNGLEIVSAIKAGLLGAIIGGIFSILRFKPPAPETFTGIMGIIGIFLGWNIISFFLNNY
tara:strand:- start:191 stop:382 length:192 start_codon:yes stop_codon:yes gene_type:complete